MKEDTILKVLPWDVKYYTKGKAGVRILTGDPSSGRETADLPVS